MDIATVTQLISAVGFPIVMCLLLMWYVKDTNEKRKDESDKFADALNSNTLVLQKLCDRLDHLEDR